LKLKNNYILWVKASDLKVGDELKTSNKSAQEFVVSVEKITLEKPKAVFDIEVEDEHNFFVKSPDPGVDFSYYEEKESLVNPVCVHNSEFFFLYNGNLAAGALALFRPGTGLVWNLMQANLSAAVNRWPTRAAMRLGAALSAGRPDAVVCNSEAARTAHAAAGYAAAKMSVIPNGVDTELYRPSENARTGVGPVVIGHLARWDPQKDHATFVRAVGRLLRRGVDVRARLAGPGVTADNPDLTRWIAETGRPECFERLGALDQTVPFYQSLDVFCLSSVGESSPYALAEAMACGLPAAATDVGDCRAVLNDGDALAPAGDDDALSRALERWARLGPEERRQKGREARARIVEHYSFRRMVDAYLDLYQAVAARRDGRG
jgi:glycosyltransferase involved in cell wall biosynthesis